MSGISPEKGSGTGKDEYESAKLHDSVDELNHRIKNLVDIFHKAEEYLQEGNEEAYLKSVSGQNQHIMQMMQSFSGMLNAQEQQIAALTDSVEKLGKSLENVKKSGGFHPPKEPEDDIPEPPDKGILGAFRR